jgi:hypothetical protein
MKAPSVFHLHRARAVNNARSIESRLSLKFIEQRAGAERKANLLMLICDGDVAAVQKRSHSRSSPYFVL